MRMLFLVNEFADVPVDAGSLAEAGSPVQSVVGGSLFCECKAAEFVRVMKETVLGEHRRKPLHSVIIETSGIADPEAIGRVMRDFGLDVDFEVHMVISITATRSFLKLVDNLPNIAAQIRTSSLVVLDKIDLSSEEDLRQVECRIGELNPEAQTVRCVYCHFPFEWMARTGKLPDAPLAVKSNPYTTQTVEFHDDVSGNRLQAWLEARPEGILRVKGSVKTDNGWLHVDKSVESLEVGSCPPDRASAIVLIAHDDDERVLQQAVEEWKNV